MIPALLFGALAFGAPLALASRAPAQGTPRDLVFSRNPNRLHRLRFETSLRYVDGLRNQGLSQKQILGVIGGRVRALGFSPVLLVMQDPTNSEIFSVLARGHGDPSDGILALVGAEPVEEPGPEQRLASPTPDPGLTTEEVRAVETALLTETNPRHLSGMSDTYAPHFPVVTSLLYAKSRVLEDGPGDHPERTFAALTEGAKGFPRGSALQAYFVSLLREVGADVKGTFRYPPADAKLASDASGDLSRAVLASAAENVPPDLVPGEVRRAICYAATENPQGMATMPQAFRKLAGDFVFTNPDGPKIVDGALLYRVLPPTGEEGYVSASALQLADAEMKPVTAGVDASREVPHLVEEIRNASESRDPQGIRARAMVEKAERAIERRRWVDWYRIER